MQEGKHADNVYALDVNNNEVYIQYVESGRKGYFCIGCKAPMQAVKPKSIRAYFRHDVKFTHGEKKCTYSDETYRHKLAKEILQDEKRIKVPALYKYPQKGEEGEPNLIRKSEYIEAHEVSIELSFYENENGEIRFGRKANINSQYLLIQPDVTFFDKNNKPILLIELAATHKVDEEKKVKLKRLGIDTVEVTIPKDSPKSIGDTLKKTSRTQWLYNYEQETAEYIPVSLSSAEGVQSIDEHQRKLFEESVKCRSAQIRNLIHGIGRCLGSEQYRTVERNLKSEIFRVEENTEAARNRWWKVCERGRKEAEQNLSAENERVGSTKKEVEAEELRFEELEEEFQSYVGGLEERYIRKRTELKDEKRSIEKEEQLYQQSDKEIRERIERGENAIGGLIISQRTIRTQVEDFERARKRIEEEFRSKGEQLEESIGRIEQRERKEIIGINRKIASISRRKRIAYKNLKGKIAKRERAKINRLSIELEQYLGRIKNGEFVEFKRDRRISYQVNEFAKAMAALDNIATAYTNRERIRKAYDAAIRGTYKDWYTKGGIY